MRYSLAIFMSLAALAANAGTVTKFVSLDDALDGLYPIAAGKCDLEVANLKLNKEPCDIARRLGDEEHLYLLMGDKYGQPILIIEGKTSDENPDWKVIYRKGEQQT